MKRIGRTLAYLLLGTVGTAGVAIVLLFVVQPIQTAFYRATYRSMGPSDATEFAILGHAVLAGSIALEVFALVGEYVSHRGENAPAFVRGLGVIGLLLLLFFVVSLAGLASLLSALVSLLTIAVVVPVLLRYRYGVTSGGLPAFVGGIPVVLFLVLLAGVGLGWGWGYVVTAEEVPASTVGDEDVADFDDAPEIRDDLFAASNCEEDASGARVCRLALRGYNHETVAARFLDRHGVRCPFRNGSTADRAETFVARHDGSYYRVSCASHGD